MSASDGKRRKAVDDEPAPAPQGLVWRRPEEKPGHSREVLAILRDESAANQLTYDFAWVAAGSWEHAQGDDEVQVVRWAELPDPADILGGEP